MGKDKKQRTVLCQTSVDVALEFFSRVMQLKEDTQEARFQILMDLANEGKMDRVWTTGRSKDQVVSDLQRDYRVLDLRKGNEDHA